MKKHLLALELIMLIFTMRLGGANLLILGEGLKQVTNIYSPFV